MKSEANVGAVIVCAGKGERTGLAYNKILHRIGQRTVVETVTDTFIAAGITNIVLVVSDPDRAVVSELVSHPSVKLCLGGNTRAESVKNGLDALGGDCNIVVIHDGARPFVTPEVIAASIKSAVEFGSGIAAVPSIDTVKRVKNGVMTAIPRAGLYNVQTPQTFRYSEILAAYEAVGADNSFTDDAEVYEHAGFLPRLSLGDNANVKITTAADLYKVLPADARIGVGFDVHRLVEGRKLILGGVEIPYIKGLDGHSDADVLTHAIMDALLSAAGLPDIGVLYPDTNDFFLGISSMKLLSDVMKHIADAKFSVINISAVIIAQEPKLAPHISSIRESLARAIGVDRSRINVSATTTERLGIIGSGDGIAAEAYCLLSENL